MLPVSHSLGFPAITRFQNAVAKLDQMLMTTIASARQAHHLSSDDFIGQMALLRDENDEFVISDTVIRDESKTFMFGAMDTTSHALAWLMYFLGQQPQLQERVVEEYDRVVRGDPVTEETLKQLKFTEACFNEVHRMDKSNKPTSLSFSLCRLFV